MSENYHEVIQPAGIAVPTGIFASLVYPVGGGANGEALVSLINQYDFRSQTLTTVPLGAGATYNSAVFDFIYLSLGFTLSMAFADQASAANGFIIQQSIDNANWDYNSITASVIANTGLGIKASQYVRYARIQYTNGAIAQGVFRLGVKFSIS